MEIPKLGTLNELGVDPQILHLEQTLKKLVRNGVILFAIFKFKRTNSQTNQPEYYRVCVGSKPLGDGEYEPEVIIYKLDEATIS